MRNRLPLLLLSLGLLLLAGSLMPRREADATLLPGGIHWAHGAQPARIGVMVADDLDRQLIANVVAEYDKLANVEIGVIEERPTAGMCAQPQATDRRYGHIAVCRWEFASGGAEGYTACAFENYTGCGGHFGFGRLSLPRANYPYYPHKICHELGHALGLNHGNFGCMYGHSWEDRNLGYCPDAVDLAELEAVHSHNDGFTPNYTVAPFTVTGQDYGCPAPPYYDDGSGQEWTPTSTVSPTSTPMPSSTPTDTSVPTATPTPTATPCVPPNAKRCR